MSWDALRLAADRLGAAWPEEVQAAARVLGDRLGHELGCGSCAGLDAEMVLRVLSVVSGSYGGTPVDVELSGAIVELAVEVERSASRCEQVSPRAGG